MKKGNLSEDTDKECLENGETEDCLNQQSNMYMTRQGQVGKWKVITTCIGNN